MKFLTKTLLYAGGAIAVAGGLYNKPEVTDYDIVSNDIPLSFDGFKIVQLSDYHNDNIEGIAELVSAEKPDLILCTGDISDDKGTYFSALGFIKKMREIAPVIMVTGNHDLWRDDFEEMQEEMKSVGAKFLHSERCYINKGQEQISIAGIDDPYTCNLNDAKRSILNDLSKIPEYDGFDILLFHRANLLDCVKKSGFNLILSGHMHGGLIRLPVVGGVAAPRSSFGNGQIPIFPKYTSGKYVYNNTIMIVNRGLGNPTFIPRFYNRPEITAITLRSKSE